MKTISKKGGPKNSYKYIVYAPYLQNRLGGGDSGNSLKDIFNSIVNGGGETCPQERDVNETQRSYVYHNRRLSNLQ